MHPVLHPDIDRILISGEEIETRCRELGSQISEVYRGRDLHIVIILKGAFMFVADLVRHIDARIVMMDFIAVSSYGASTRSSGTVRITKDLQNDLLGRDALIVEDIVDTGLTLQFLLQHIHSHRPNSVRVATLLSKPSARKVEVPIDFTGFEVPNEFVVGFGLDYDQRYRQLPYIGVLKPGVHGG